MAVPAQPPSVPINSSGDKLHGGTGLFAQAQMYMGRVNVKFCPSTFC